MWSDKMVWSYALCFPFLQDTTALWEEVTIPTWNTNEFLQRTVASRLQRQIMYFLQLINKYQKFYSTHSLTTVY